MNTNGHSTNKLISETSPYLLQHANNPVNWHPWGDEAFAKARAENKPLLISIGYSACHWCHVMEKESFTSLHVASVMNKYFVCIKVDREERPDIDQVYMDAVRSLNGTGGWPLNCFALPDGRPFWGGTYFPSDQWIQILERINYLWQNKNTDLIRQAEAVSEGIQQQELYSVRPVRRDDSTEDITETWENLKRGLDFLKGGLKGSPKFPMPIVLSYMLRYAAYIGRSGVLDPLWVSLNRMACGGIYDQIGGGFSRYSVDENWKVPHFEKMLYDNAQLALLYTEGWQISKNDFYRTIAEDTLQFVNRELTSSEGAFYSSIDADSEGEEGKYYVWTETEIREVLGADADLIIRYYGIGAEGYWENDNNILVSKIDLASFLVAEGLSATDWNEKLKKANALLLDRRTLRVPPGKDDKVLASWNALMLKSFSEASIAFNNDDYLKVAERNARFLLTYMSDDHDRLFHSWRNGTARINGFLEDYAFAIDAFISLYQATFNLAYLNQAMRWTQVVIDHFYNEDQGIFYFTSDEDEPLVARRFELHDGVTPSPNSVMARSLVRLAVYFEKGKYRENAQRALDVLGDLPLQHPSSFANWAVLRLDLMKGPSSVVFNLVDGLEQRKRIGTSFLPFVALAGNHLDLPLTSYYREVTKTGVFICSDRQCYPPVQSPKEILLLLDSFEK
ncbi:MAG: thioredoxin domain-containing protein [Bacteroidetes bacterium]|nr:thioredoxin domain-containing protein [Bacteroidota bacterium]